MKKNLNFGNLIAETFKNNWKDNFVFDAANDSVFTYEEFFSKAKLYSKNLAELGIAENNTVVLILNNSLDLMILYFAGLLLGIRLVPIDPFKGTEEINEILSQVEYQAVITDARLNNFTVKKVITLDQFKKTIDGHESVKQEELSIFDHLNYEKTYLIAFTSGSTGLPKGVMHSFKNLLASALSFGQRLNFGRNNVFYHNLPMTYMAGILNQLLMPFICGSKIVVGDRFSITTINNFWNFPIKYSANTFWFTPTILSLLMNLDRGKAGIDFAAKKSVIGCVGTAPLNYQLKQKFEEKYKINLFESYGLSETLFIATEAPSEKKVKGSVGRVLDGVKINFASDQEILLEADWMFLGYVNKEYGDIILDNKFLSGDLGEIDENNFLHITGRKKDIIIKGGTNISPRRIEDFISNFNYFNENVILGIEDEILGERIVCFYTPDKENYSGESEKIINREIIEKLGKDFKIDEFKRLEQIPKNTNGKVDKINIKKIYKDI